MASLSDLYLYPYKISVLHKLTACYQQHILGFAAQAEYEGSILHSMWFLDEAHFHVSRIVNIQSVCFWAMENLHVFTEKVLYAGKITVWAAMLSYNCSSLTKL